MKRKEETVVVEEVIEKEVPTTSKEEEKIEKEEIENTDFQVVDNKIVDKDGFAVSDDKISDESEKSQLFVEVDSLRQKYLKSTKLMKYLTWGLMLPILAGALVAVFTLNGQTVEDWVKYLVIGLIVALGIGLIVFKVLSKRYLDNKARTYVKSYYSVTTNYIVSGEGFSENLKSVGSRNLVTFNHNGRNFSFVDLAAQVQGVKKLEAIFVGKVLKYTLTKEVNGRLLGQILGNNKISKPIDGFAGLEQISKTGNYVFYSNMHKEKNLLTKTVTDLFGRYHLNNDLLDVIISVNHKEIVVALDYNDPVMQLPVDKKFNKQQIDDIKTALFNSISIIEAIADKLEK